MDELKRIAQLPLPQVVNVVIGGKTPALPVSEFACMGFGVVPFQQQGILDDSKALLPRAVTPASSSALLR